MFLLTVFKIFRYNNLLLYGIEEWHFGWDYEIRRKTYINSFKDDNYNIIFIDFSRLSHLYILTFLAKLSNSFENQDIFVNVPNNLYSNFCRNYWDKEMRSNSRPISTNHAIYMNDFISFCNRKKLKRIFDLTKATVSITNLRAISLTQTSYEDWATYLIADKVNIPVYFCEGHYGMTKYKQNVHSYEMNYITEHKNEIVPFLEPAKVSMENRVNGKFSASTLSYYMDNIKMDITDGELTSEKFILYLHCFGDSANNTLVEYRETIVDYYHETLRILEQFENCRQNIIIKFHPLSSSYSFDRKIMPVFRKFVDSLQYVNVIEGEFSISDLYNINPEITVLSSRGSILSEACYAGLRTGCFTKNILNDLCGIKLIKIDDNLVDNCKAIEPSPAKHHALLPEALRLYKQSQHPFVITDYNRKSTTNPIFGANKTGLFYEN